MLDLVRPVHEQYKDIYFIEGQNKGRYPYSHALVIKDWIIDTGISSGFMRKILRDIPINNVLLSHWHEDHINGNRFLSNAKFFCHHEDQPVIEDVKKMYAYYSITEIPEQIELFDTILAGLRLVNVKIEKNINDNDIIQIGDSYKLKVIHTPGHTKGHCCFYELTSKIAFLADIELSSLGPWYGAADSNVIDFEASIQKIEKLDIEIAVSSHMGLIFGSSTIKNSLKEYKSIINKRDNKILDHFSETKPIKPIDLVGKNIVYKNYDSEYKVYLFLAECVMIEKHFEKFLQKNIIEKVENGYILK